MKCHRGVDLLMCQASGLRCGVLHSLPFTHHLSSSEGTSGDAAYDTAGG